LARRLGAEVDMRILPEGSLKKIGRTWPRSLMAVNHKQS
jgi:hypothetical protein